MAIYVRKQGSDELILVAGAGGGGVKYEAGDGIVIDESTISAVWPNVVLTQAEYDALSEADKMKNAIYIVWDSQSGGNNGDDQEPNAPTLGPGWNVVTMPPGTGWGKIAYGDGKFVALCSGTNQGAYSVNGLTWTSITLPVSANWTRLIYGGDKFVAVSEQSNHTAMYSNDGIIWNVTSLPNDTLDYYRYLACNDAESESDRRFVAFESTVSQYMATSNNGIIWTRSPVSAGYLWSGVAFGDKKFAAISRSYTTEDGATHPSISSTSMSGDVWLRFDMPNGQWSSIAYGNGRYIAVEYIDSATQTGSNRFAWNTDNGVLTQFDSWNLSELPRSARWGNLIYGGGRFLVISNQDRYALCGQDGITWEEIEPLPEDGWWTGLAYGNGVYVATSNTENIAAVYSFDQTAS